MRKSGLLLLLVFVVPMTLIASTRASAQPAAAAEAFDQLRVSQVTGNARAFMAPRTLDPIPLPTMALWGLQA